MWRGQDAVFAETVERSAVLGYSLASWFFAFGVAPLRSLVFHRGGLVVRVVAADAVFRPMQPRDNIAQEMKSKMPERLAASHASQWV
jgi:hypothetical protein